VHPIIDATILSHPSLRVRADSNNIVGAARCQLAVAGPVGCVCLRLPEGPRGCAERQRQLAVQRALTCMPHRRIGTRDALPDARVYPRFHYLPATGPSQLNHAVLRCPAAACRARGLTTLAHPSTALSCDQPPPQHHDSRVPTPGCLFARAVPRIPQQHNGHLRSSWPSAPDWRGPKLCSIQQEIRAPFEK
jgi:hypothetical protein